jgi:hypothetical protein
LGIHEQLHRINNNCCAMTEDLFYWTALTREMMDPPSVISRSRSPRGWRSHSHGTGAASSATPPPPPPPPPPPASTAGSASSDTEHCAEIQRLEGLLRKK